MREQYWNFYVSLVHQSYYYKFFRIFYGRINWALSSFCTLVSLSSIATWGIWKTHPVLWTVLICFSQVIQAILPQFPYNDLMSASKMIINPLENLLLDVRHSWLKMEYSENYSDDDIIALLCKYEQEYSKLISQFFPASYLPEIRWCENKAEADCRNYFSTTYLPHKEV